jgi:excisionase family DNA binding protein
MPRITSDGTLDDRTQPVVVKPGTAAEMLDCTRSHVYELIARGQLRKITVGRMSRIPVDDIYKLVNLDPPTAPTHRRNLPRND